MPQARIAAIILAGGQSTRMGRDKATLPWQGERLVDHIARVVNAAGIRNILVSGQIDGFNCISDIVPQKGPVGGICAALHKLKNRYNKLLFIPVDVPYISVDCLQNLMKYKKGCEAQFYNGHPLPLVLTITPHVRIYTRHVHATLQTGADYSVRHYLGGLQTHAMPLPAECACALTNTNTPQDWQEFTHEYSH